MMFTEDQIVSAIVRACEEINCRELNDIAALLETTDAKTMTTTSRALESVTDFARRMCSAIDASDPTSVAHTAVSLADLGGRVESWRQPIFAGLDEAIADIGFKDRIKSGATFGGHVGKRHHDDCQRCDRRSAWKYQFWTI